MSLIFGYHWDNEYHYWLLLSLWEFGQVQCKIYEKLKIQNRKVCWKKNMISSICSNFHQITDQANEKLLPLKGMNFSATTHPFFTNLVSLFPKLLLTHLSKKCGKNTTQRTKQQHNNFTCSRHINTLLRPIFAGDQPILIPGAVYFDFIATIFL